MHTMYDALNAKNIPRSTPPFAVAGYTDKIHLEPWTQADWDLFPKSVHVHIVKKSSSIGHVLDVEPGDSTPGEAPTWAKYVRRFGIDPIVYCNAATWAQVQGQFTIAKVAQPHYWIAHYDGIANLPELNGIVAVGKQYRDSVAPGYDVSCINDIFVQAVSGEVKMEDDMALTDKVTWTSRVDGKVHTENDMGDAFAAALAMQELWTKGYTGIASAGPGYLFVTRILAAQTAEKAAVDALTGLVAEQNGLTVADVEAAVQKSIADAAAKIVAAVA